MSDTDQMTDTAELHELRDSLSDVAMPERPRLEAITARGRARRRHRLSRAAGVSVAGVAAGTALAFGLTSAHGPAPVHGTIRTLAPRTIRTAAFKIVKKLQRQGHADPQPERVPRPGDPSERPRQIRHPGEGHLRQLLLLRSRAGWLFAGRVLAATRGPRAAAIRCAAHYYLRPGGHASGHRAELRLLPAHQRRAAGLLRAD